MKNSHQEVELEPEQEPGEDQQPEPETDADPTPKTPKERLDKLEAAFKNLKTVLATHGIHF